MALNIPERTSRRVGSWRVWAGLWAAVALAGVAIIVAPLVASSLPAPRKLAALAGVGLSGPPAHHTQQGAGGAPPAVPLWISAPAAQINGPVVPVGVDAQGAMQAPEGNNSDPVWSEAFWWHDGVMLGQIGNAVIGGHLDRKDGSPALFWNLSQLRVGDSVWVQTAQKTTLHFVVRAVQTFTNPTGGLADPVMQRIFGPAQTANLNLITCAGAWTGSEYTKKLVVFATLV